MNLQNAMGKFGALVVDVVTFVKEWLAGVSDDFAEWLGTEEGKAALRTAVGMAMKSLTDAYEAFKEEAKKLFVPAGELFFPGDKGGWKVGEFFTTDNPKTKFCHVYSNLLVFFGNDEIGESLARNLSVRRLVRKAKDGEILPQLGDDPDLTAGELRWLLENGGLTRGQWYAGCLKNRSGERCTFRFNLCAYGWHVYCYPVPDGSDWGAGHHFFSPTIQNSGT